MLSKLFILLVILSLSTRPVLGFHLQVDGKQSIPEKETDPKFRIELQNLSCIEWGFYSNEIKFSLWDEKGVEVPGAFIYQTVLRLILLPASGTITIDPGVTLMPGLKPGKYTVKLSILLKTTTFALTILPGGKVKGDGETKDGNGIAKSGDDEDPSTAKPPV